MHPLNWNSIMFPASYELRVCMFPASYELRVCMFPASYELRVCMFPSLARYELNASS